MAPQQNRAAGSYGANRRSNGNSSLPPLTEAEKSIVKDGWGSEYKFLQSYGLNIYDNAKRAEGRDILKGYVSATENFRTNRDDYRAESSSRNHYPPSSESTQPHVASHRFRDDYDQRRAGPQYGPTFNTFSSEYFQHDLAPIANHHRGSGHPSDLEYRTDDYSHHSRASHPNTHVYRPQNGDVSYPDDGSKYARDHGGRNGHEGYVRGENYNNRGGHYNNDPYDNVDGYGNKDGYGGGNDYDKYN
jgi:hypothetical protein